jgi:hypothetical protein
MRQRRSPGCSLRWRRQSSHWLRPRGLGCRPSTGRRHRWRRSCTFADMLDMLNDGRKVAVYEGEEPELGAATFESLLADVESAVVAAEEASQ